MKLRHPSLPGVRKIKTRSFAGKVMLIAFWELEGLVYAEFMHKGISINSKS